MTPRLRLDPLVASDAEVLHPVLDDPALHEFTGGDPLEIHQLRVRFAAWESRRSPDGKELWLNWTLRLRDSGEAIGYVQATIDDHGRANLAYVVGSRWQKQGLAAEAVRGMVDALRERWRVGQVRAEIAAGNLASERVAASAGLIRTARLSSEGEVVWERHLGL